MTKTPEPASFDDFLKAPERLAKQLSELAEAPAKKSRYPKRVSYAAVTPKTKNASSHKEKVGLTIDSNLIDAIDDYIYHERKQGRRLKKNDVYEAALRQFLGLEGEDRR